MTDENDKPPLSRATKIFIAVGALILVVPAAYILTAADWAFREECKAKCASNGKDYKVIAVVAPLGEYPAECRCITAGEKKWWQLWR